MTLAQINARLSDLDRSQLPSVEQAQAIQHERQPARDAMREAREAAKGRIDDIRPENSRSAPPKVLQKYAREVVGRREPTAALSQPGRTRTRTTEARSAATGNVGRAAERTAGKGAGILARGILGALAGLFKLFDLFPAKPPSPEQQKRNYRAAKEQEATDDIAAKKEAVAEQERRQRNHKM
jgi:hypothetical protein